VNSELRRIYGHKRKAVTKGWRKLYNVELHNLCYSLNIVHVTKLMMGEVKRTNSTHNIDENYTKNLGWETLREETALEN
jgi:hypothetical protein